MPLELGPKQKSWINALRTGGYKQGKYVLFDESDNTYCCLGGCEQSL